MAQPTPTPRNQPPASRKRAGGPGRALSLGLALLACLGAGRPAHAQTGLLLGFADPDSSSTLWLTRSEGRFRILRLAGILVPRPDGLWRIGTDTVDVKTPPPQADSGGVAPTDSAAGVLVHLAGLWAAAVSRQPVIGHADTQLAKDYARAGSNAVARRKLALTFVGEEYLSIEDALALDTIFAKSERAIGRLDSLAATGYAYRTSLGSYPPDPHVSADFLKRHTEWCMKRANASWWDTGGPQPTSSWGIARGQGYWRYVRRFSVSEGPHRGFEYDCRVPFLPPASIVGSSELRPAWSAVSARVPDARDAFSSPDGKYIVVLTQDELRVQRVSGARVGSLILRTAAPGLPVVQVRWAAGEDVARWSRDLAAVAPATQAQQLEEQRAPARRSQPARRRRRHRN